MEEKQAEKTPKIGVKSLFKLEKNKTNPFIVNLKGKMFLQPKPNTILAKGEQIVDTNTGEVIKDSVIIGRRKVVDRTMFAKLYFTEIATLLELSKAAFNLLLYIAKVMDFDNKVIINAEADCKSIGYAKASNVRTAIKELLSNGIIAVGPVLGVYWVNPIYICKGERFGIYTEVVTEEFNKEQIENRLKEQAQNKLNSLDEHTQKSIDAMNKRAEQEYLSEKSHESNS